MCCSYGRKQAGFTLIEMVSVIVLLGIVGVGVLGYLRTTAEAFTEVTRRDEVTVVARNSTEKISRELRTALPGSVRIGGTAGVEACIEFVPIVEADIYTSIPFGSAGTTVTVLTQPRSSTGTIAIYTLATADVYDSDNTVNHRAAYTNSSSGNPSDLTLSPAKDFPEQSPTDRLFYIDDPVSYCVTANQLIRYSGYGFNESQAIPPSTGDQLVAENIQLIDGGTVTPFDYTSPGLQTAGIVHLDFRFLARDTTTEWLRFSHDVAIRNVP